MINTLNIKAHRVFGLTLFHVTKYCCAMNCAALDGSDTPMNGSRRLTKWNSRPRQFAQEEAELTKNVNTVPMR